MKTRIRKVCSATSATFLKEKIVLEEVKYETSSTLSKEGSIQIEKLKKEMDRFCFVYDVYYRILVHEHELNSGEDKKGRVNSELVALAHNVRVDSITDN